MRQIRFLLVSLALLFVVGCATTPAEPVVEDKPDAAPSFFDMTDADNNDEYEAPDPETCDHVFEYYRSHSYQRMINGMPMIGICTVTKCAKCNQIRHECQQRK